MPNHPAVAHARTATTPIAHIVAGLLFGLATAAASVGAHAQPSATPASAVRAYDIAAGTVDQALSRFGRQAGVEISVDGQLTAGLQSPGVKGSLTAAEALNALLAGTGLEGLLLGNGSYLVQKATLRAPRAAPADERNLPTVSVRDTAIRLRDDGTTKGYAADSTRALGTDLPLQQTPGSVNVVTQDFIRDTNVRALGDLAAYIPGVTTGYGGGTNEQKDALVSRFFGGVTQYNGFDGLDAGDSRHQPFFYERIDIIKGPAGVEGGAGSTGGSVNYITKKPQRDFAAEFGASLGDYNRRVLQGDVTGSLSDDGRWQYRLIGVYEQDAAWQQGLPDRIPHYAFMPSVRFQYAPDSHVTLEVERRNSNEPLNRGVLYLRGFGFANDFAPREWNFGSSQSSQKANTSRVELTLDHRFNNTFSLLAAVQDTNQKVSNGAYRNRDFSGLYGPDGLTYNGSSTLVPIFYDGSGGERTGRGARLVLTGDFDVGATRHTVNLGARANDSRLLILYDPRNNTNVIDLRQPDFNQLPVFSSVGPPGQSFDRVIASHALLGSWLARWTPALRTLVGVRRDTSTSDSTSMEAGAVVFQSLGQRQSVNSVRVSASYDLNPDTSVFAGYADNRDPRTDVSRSGPVNPLLSKSVEAGVKTSLFGGKALWTNAVYQINRDGITECDPTDPNCNFVVPFGSVRLRGFESELQGDFSSVLRGSLGLSVSRGKVTKNNEGLVGNEFYNIPRVQASGFVSYRWAQLGLERLVTRLGVVHSSQRWGNSANTFRLPAYTRLDIGATYQLGPKDELWFQIENLTDKTYYTGTQDRPTDVFVGNRRLMQAGYRHRF